MHALHLLTPCSLVRTMAITSCFAMWIFWLCTYMSQMYPIIGPELVIGDVYLNI